MTYNRILILLCISLSLAQAANEKHFIEQLPDYPKTLMKSRWYSGFYNVTKFKHLHYLFIESLNDPKTDPVIVFFNGGPGGSAIDLAFSGLGPLISKGAPFDPKDNPNHWCSNASVIFMDNPAGVGFSYAPRKYDDIHNDFSFANDALSFFKQFYNDWPELASNLLYISGGSYGGIYAPWLAWSLHTFNQQLALNKTDTTKPFPLKGFIIANGAIDYMFDPHVSAIEMLRAFSMIPESLYQIYQENNCTIHWIWFYQESLIPWEDDICSQMFIAGLNNTDFNIYNLRKIQKTPPKEMQLKLGKSMVNGTQRIYKRHEEELFGDLGKSQELFRKYNNLTHPYLEETTDAFNGTTVDYLNREDVRAAFHVPTYVPAFRGLYTDLTYLPNYEGSGWIYDIFNKYGYQMLHIMGDTDGILSTNGLWNWLRSVKWPVTKKWTQWTQETESEIILKGFTKEYGNLKIVTIRGEGHSAVVSNMEMSAKLIRNFAHNLPLDKD